MPTPAVARPSRLGEDFQTTRSAIRPSAIGNARSATQIGTPSAISLPASRCTCRRRTPPSARIVVTSAATNAATMPAICRARPSGSIVPVASASSLPSRAAMAAPANPTMSVRCAVNGAAPGTPVLKKRRSTTSLSGRIMMPSAASEAMRSSASPNFISRASLF